MSAPSEAGWSHHCGDLAAAAVLAAAGRDIWSEIGPRPGSWREVAALYRRFGVRTLAGLVTALLGPERASTRLARRGDVVMVRGALGVCRGELAECIGATVRMKEAERAWDSKARPHISKQARSRPN
ncbi:MAG: hypothetical protein AB7O91_04125 [Sphingomonas sp.]